MPKKKKGVITGNVKSEIKNECKREFKDPMFVGVDPSYNGFGIIVLDKNAEIIEQKLISIPPDKDKDHDTEKRIIELEKEFKFIPNIVCLNKVYVEGPSYSSNGQFVLQMGALHFYLRIFLFKKKVDYKIVPPNTLKKFVTGKGVAKKELMLLNVFKKWGVEFSDNNLADAYGLARMALEDFKSETK